MCEVYRGVVDLDALGSRPVMVVMKVEIVVMMGVVVSE